ncbi:hypothetical protein [Pelagibacterium lacus]|uniref:hypothetical protein n=1 Tax=Pelagibacterium lacus TaxID=2282655 RepID=UPI001314F577|nr:hypothetical protein [Pelagibacterium lacus]
MQNNRIFLIAAGLVVAVLALIGLGLSASEFGLVMLGGALVVAVAMFVLTRRRHQRMTQSDKEDRDPPQL